ncbi:hypothetical protein [Paraburkholderia sp. J67]|uniref:hypothetical protein n=1 Tax=Paraburkholderia sp. J67 TaxID=2805435 RepID=UPI002ABD2451|nr:hypothetical protein [Paraburkholderia sp. J67]
MNKATCAFIAAAAALTLSSVAYAQNNTLATPSVKSPVSSTPATPATSGYGAPGATNSESGMSGGAMNSNMPNGANTDAGATNAYGVNNTLARPSTKSPAGQ